MDKIEGQLFLTWICATVVEPYNGKTDGRIVIPSPVQLLAKMFVLGEGQVICRYMRFAGV